MARIYLATQIVDQDGVNNTSGTSAPGWATHTATRISVLASGTSRDRATTWVVMTPDDGAR